MRYLAPAGAPIGARELREWAGRLVSRSDATEALRHEVRLAIGVDHSFPVCTGRAGLTVLLRALARLADPRRNEVVLPGYTCFSVAASVVRAGLRARLVDIDPSTLDFDAGTLDRLDHTRTLAIVATNLYGMPSDMPRLTDIAGRHRVFLVDDAAQSLGATVGSRPCGAWGDAGLLSLDKGKNISAIDGGIIATSSGDVASVVAPLVAELPEARHVDLSLDVVKLFGYSMLLSPRAYWIPNAIPQLGLGTTIFDPDFAVHAMPRPLAMLGATMFGRLHDYNEHRRRIAHSLVERLADVAGVDVPRPVSSSVPVYLRLPVLVADPGLRSQLLDALHQHGIGATASYPTSLADVPDLRASLAAGSEDLKGARAVAARIVTLPTHPYVTPQDVDLMAGVVRRVMGATGHVKAAPALAH